MKTSELIGPALEWAVGVAYYNDGRVVKFARDTRFADNAPAWVEVENSPGSAPIYFRFTPSTSWAQGGPIIDAELIKISPYHNQGGWWAEHAITGTVCDGPTALITACRCYVASKLGDEVDVPEELL